VRLFAAVDAVRTAIRAEPDLAFVVERHSYEQALAASRTALPAERFAAAWAAGAALSLDEAIAEATVLASQMASPDPKRPRAEAAGLTVREREVLRLLVLGWTDKEIAAELGIGRRTVSTHVATLRAKLGAPSRSAAAAIAARDRLV
jgi:DNA-binding NarL/FixJ family response regulator